MGKSNMGGNELSFERFKAAQLADGTGEVGVIEQYTGAERNDRISVTKMRPFVVLQMGRVKNHVEEWEYALCGDIGAKFSREVRSFCLQRISAVQWTGLTYEEWLAEQGKDPKDADITFAYPQYGWMLLKTCRIGPDANITNHQPIAVKRLDKEQLAEFLSSGYDLNPVDLERNEYIPTFK